MPEKEYNSYEGEVVKGRQLGRTIGIPTINIFPTTDTSDLERGVYFSTIEFTTGKYAGCIYYGVTNVGCKPTVQNTDMINFETFIFDFSDDVYGEKVIIHPIHFSRPETRFSSIEELTLQIREDANSAREFFAIIG